MNQTIAQVFQEFSLGLYQPIVPRSLDLGEPLAPRAGNLVKAITGMRRSGKSYRLFQEMELLHARGIPWERICYFNFEDDRVAPVTPETGDAVLETYQYLHPNVDLTEGMYLFFDELQEMRDWGAWLRRIVDTRRATIYVTGSSSKMLSSELATEFRGRAIEFQLFPYSFRELVAQDQELSSHLDDPVQNEARRVRLAHLLDDYLRQGGFPAVQGLPTAHATALLQSYVQRVVARDVVERHDVARPRIASLLANRLMGLNARQLSLRKVEGDLRAAGLGAGRRYLSDLVSYFEDAFLVFQVREISLSLSDRTTSMPKIYAVDPGLALACSRAGTSDLGQRLEGTIYLELRRRLPGSRRGSVSFYRTKQRREVDFVVGDALDLAAFELIQVTERMDDPATAERETRALWEALGETGLEEGLLIVGDGSETIYENAGRRIRQVPAWKWLLGASSAA